MRGDSEVNYEGRYSSLTGSEGRKNAHNGQKGVGDHWFRTPPL